MRGMRHDFVPTLPRTPPALFASSHTPQAADIWTYMSYGPFAGRRPDARLAGLMRGLDRPYYDTVIDRGTGRPGGMCSLLRIDSAMRTMELGHIRYVPDAQVTA